MSQINLKEFFEPTEDLRYSVFNTSIPVDGSSSGISISRRSAMIRGGDSTGLNATGNPTLFRITSSTDLRNYLSSFSFLVKGHAYKLVQGVQTAVVHTTTAIDWDSAAAIIENAYISYNNNSEIAENYNSSTYSVAHKVRMLQTLSRTCAEGMDDVLFTPCHESIRDTTTVLSPETLVRSAQWLSAFDGSRESIVYHKKNWPLSYLFSSAAASGYLDVNQIDVCFTFKRPTRILHKLTENSDTNYYVVDDIELVVDQTKMSAPQASIEIKDKKTGDDVQRFGFLFYDTLTTSYTNSQKLLIPSVENLQSLVVCFPSTCDGKGVNPLQFILNDMTSVSAMYGSLQPLEFPINFDPDNRLTNVELFYHFKKWINKPFSTNFVPFIDWVKGYGQMPLITTTGTGGEGDPIITTRTPREMYALMCFNFFSSDNFHLTSGTQLEIQTSQSSQGASNVNIHIIKVRSQFVQLTHGLTSKLY